MLARNAPFREPRHDGATMADFIRCDGVVHNGGDTANTAQRRRAQTTSMGTGSGGLMLSFHARVRDAFAGVLARLLVRLLSLAAAAAVCAGLAVTAAEAQTCGAAYRIREGDTLAGIAARVYGSPSQWTVIFYANQDRLGANASLLVPGLAIVVPCVGAAAKEAAPPVPPQQPGADPSAIMISTMVRRIELLTADGYAPFTGRALEGGGMLTEVITAAMNIVKKEARGRFDYKISWVNDWSAHLNPLLLTRAFDVGFPWARPDCDGGAALDAAAQFRCRRFFFSEPLYEVITSLFVRNASPVVSLRSEKLDGSTLCLPAGQAVYELDQGGRNWVKDGKITLVRPPTVDECFRMLEAGTVTGVVTTEFAGRASMNSLGMAGRIRMLNDPVALTSLHVVVSKSHPHARTILYYINTALAKLRDSGDYNMIIARHLDRFWETQPGSAPAPVRGDQGSEPPQAGAR